VVTLGDVAADAVGPEGGVGAEPGVAPATAGGRRRAITEPMTRATTPISGSDDLVWIKEVSIARLVPVCGWWPAVRRAE
jgi:hypothetical protein